MGILGVKSANFLGKWSIALLRQGQPFVIYY
jgi:hypothetical protein